MAKKGTNAMPCAEHRFADGHVETESVLLDRLRHYRVVATVDDAPATPDPAFVQRLLDERAPGQAEVTGSTWSSRFRVHHRVADRYRNGRLLLAGDAAHVHSPAGGQGMNTGIQDGHALGHAIAAGRLDDYEAQRRPVARRVVAFTHRMTRVATARSRVISDPAPRPARPSAPGSRAR
ncbi:FAD-dependent monooxygenase [Streptomyces parvulus]|uniref:FAD-dependent monooxygenase n=1 Tax=Streptomyces parvulus TaxID=146923 RepID=UPI0033AAB7E7